MKTDEKLKWWKALFTFRMWSVLSLGFSSGLPFLLTRDTLKAWLTDEKLDLTSIGLFSLVGLPYTLKFVWAPLLDKWVPPLFGRRRGWIFVSQIAVALALVGLSFSRPLETPQTVALLALIVSFMAATQDIAIDAYRRDVLLDNELGLGASLGVNGYRIGMLVGGAAALALADQVTWQTVYLLMAGIMVINTLLTFFAPDPENEAPPPPSWKKAVIDPFKEFFSRNAAFTVLAFILLYKVGDAIASTQFTPFYLLTGFTKTEIAAVAKVFGFWATIIGGLIGGTFILKLGYYKSLWIFGVLQAVSTLGFAVLSHVGRDLGWLTAVIAFENLTSGMGTAAYAGFMAKMCNRQFTATQYALLSSLMGVPLVILGASSGWLATQMGWYGFFIFCTVLAIPGLLILFCFRRTLLD